MPAIADNALVKAAPLIERIASYRPDPQLIPEAQAFLAVVNDGHVPAPHEALAVARAIHTAVAEMLEPLLGATFSPTLVHASDRRNVIPALCEVTVDNRLLPGQTPDDAAAIVRELLGPGDWEL